VLGVSLRVRLRVRVRVWVTVISRVRVTNRTPMFAIAPLIRHSQHSALYK